MVKIVDGKNVTSALFCIFCVLNYQGVSLPVIVYAFTLLKLLEGTAPYAGLLLAPARDLVFGQKRAFYAVFAYFR